MFAFKEQDGQVDDEGLRIITGTTEADSTQLYRLTGWDYSNNYVVGNTITNRQDDDYTIVQVGGWIDYTIDIPDGHEYFELSSFIVALGSFHLHDLALWQITLTNGAGGTDTDAVPEAPTAPTLTATDTSITVTLSSDPTSDAAITSRDIRWRETGGTWATVEGITSPHTISTGIAESTEYEAQWRAVSSAGDGAWSPSDTITTLATDLMPSLPSIANQSATVGTAFSLTFNAATGGDTPLSYSVSGNPAWLTLSSLTLSGTPTATGTHTVTVTVTDNDNDTDSDSFVLTVSAAVVLLTLADFTVPTGNELVTSALIEAGAADFIYRDDDPTAVETSDSGEILDGDLEPATGYRMSLVRHPAANGFIFNDRPEADSISDFFGTGGDGADLTIHVQDDTGVASFVPVDATVFASSDDFVRWDVPDAFETVLARIGTGDRLIIAFTRETVTDLMPTAPTVANRTGTVGTAFSVTLPIGTGGDTPLAYSVSDEPSWASFNTTSRILSGTPNATGTTTVTYTVTDDDGDTDSSTFNIVVSAADLMPTLPAIADQTATVGTAFSLTFDAATGGNTPLSYSVSGNPSWLTLSGLTLSGTPTAAGTPTITVTVEDDDGDTASQSFTLTTTVSLDLPGIPTSLATEVLTTSSIRLTWEAPTDGGAVDSYDVESKNTDTSYTASTDTTSPVDFTGLTRGIRNSFRVRAVNTDGESAWVTVSRFIPQFTVTITSPSDGSTFSPGVTIQLRGTITNLNDPNAFIFWDISPSGGTVNNPESLTTANWEAPSPEQNTVYEIYLGADDSPNGNYGEVSITVTIQGTGPPTAPGTPGMPTVTAGSVDGTLDITWAAPTIGDPPTDYTVEARRQGTSSWFLPSFPNNVDYLSRSVTASGFLHGFTYDIRVFASNDVGSSGFSSIGSGTTSGTAEPPGIVSPIPVVTAVDATTVEVTWTEPEDTGETSPAQGYDLRWDDNNIVPVWMLVEDVESPYELAVPGSGTGETYYVQARAKNSGGNGPWSGSGEATTIANAVPGIPTNVDAVPTSTDTIEISWVAPTGSGTPSTYGVNWRPSANQSWQGAGVTFDTSPAILTPPDYDLQPGTSYDIRIRSQNSAGNSNWVVVEDIVVFELPGVPANVALTTVDHDSLQFSWADGVGGVPDTYQGQYKKTADPNWIAITGNITSTYDIDGLDPETEYEARVRATNEGGSSSYSSPDSATTDAAPVLIPANVMLDVVDHDTLRLTWSEGMGGTPDSYQGEYKKTADSNWIAITGNITSPYDIDGLDSETEYEARVRATDEGVSFSYSDSDSATTNAAPVLVPAAPAGLMAQAGDAQAILMWNDPGDSTITRYEYQIDSVSGTWTGIAGSGATTVTATITSLTNGTELTIYLRAVSNAGDGNSASVSVTPVEPGGTSDTPSSPSRFTVDSQDIGVILLWDAPENDGNSTINRYEVTVTTVARGL